MWQKLIIASEKWVPDSDHLQKRAWQKHEIYENMEYSYNFSNSKDHQPYLQGSSPPGIWLRLGPIIQPIPHRAPVALFWDLFRGLHLTLWRWMVCRRINYSHDLMSVSETLQLDYPRIPPDHGWSTFSAMTHYLQLSSIFVDFHLHLQSSRTFTIKIAEVLCYQESSRDWSNNLWCDRVSASSLFHCYMLCTVFPICGYMDFHLDLFQDLI